MDCDNAQITTERETPEPVEQQVAICGNNSASWLQFIETEYGSVHGHASIGTCIISILMNIANVIVLTRRNMVSPSNTLLTAIAFVDILKMSTYMFYAYFFNITSRLHDPSNRYSASLVLFLILQTNSALVLHCNNTWLTVLLAVFRYIVVCVDNGRQKITVQLARRSVALVFLLSCLAYIPHYFSLGLAQECDLVQSSESNRSNQSAYRSGDAIATLFDQYDNHNRSVDERDQLTLTLTASQSETAQNESSVSPAAGTCYYLVNPYNEQLRKLSHLIHGPVLKILSSILICIPTVLLIVRMREAAKTRKRLKSKLPQHESSRSSINANETSCCGSGISYLCSVPERLRSKFSDRSSRMPSDGDCMLKCSNSSRASNAKDDNTGLPASDSRAKAATNDHTRTTTMLIAVITSFVIVEFPQGVILWVGHFNKFFFECVYSPLGDLFDALVLISSTINFLIYCTMSRQYRETFRMVLIEPLLLHRKSSKRRVRNKEPPRAGTGTGTGTGNKHSTFDTALRTSACATSGENARPCTSCATQVSSGLDASMKLGDQSNADVASRRGQNLLTVPTSAI